VNREPAHLTIAAMIRGQIADGTLEPGGFAPSIRELRRITGHDKSTCQKAVRELVIQGELVRWPYRTSRPTVPGTTVDSKAITNAQALSKGLRTRRGESGLTQEDLAELIGFSVTAIGHAETCRLWQAKDFWEKVDDVLEAQGALLALYDRYKSNPGAPAVAPAVMDKDSLGHSKIAEALRDAVKVVDEILPWQPGQADDRMELRKVALEVTFAKIMSSSDG
jgi:DNA-binding transcriptional MocR family regulator